jgi:hypothetical protein
MSADGRYLWFYCAFPPSGNAAQGRTLGLLDLQTGEISHFPETQFNHASPYVDPATGWVYWGMWDSLWRRGPGPKDTAERVGFIPAELVGNRFIERFATHLTRSADGKEFFVDAAFGLQFVFGSIDIASGDYQFWHRFDRNHNHAQFSPTDPDLIVFAEENHPDPVTGLSFPILNRMWLLRRGGQPRPIFQEATKVTHEWWDADGQHVWCVKGGQGTWRVNIDTAEVEDLQWPQGAWHSHNHSSGKYIIGDTNERFYRGCPSTVQFLNRETGQSVRLVDNPAKTDLVGQRYHIDPHPRFVGNEQFVAFTTTVCGEADIALIPTADLIERTSQQ